MPDRIPTTMSGLSVGDYVEGKGGTVWKVGREAFKDGVRFLGLESPTGKVIQKADERPITMLLYGGGAITEGEVIAAVGGKRFAVEVEQRWFHPKHEELEADQRALAAHLVRFHANETLTPDMAAGDLAVIHHAAHAPGLADHNHEGLPE